MGPNDNPLEEAKEQLKKSEEKFKLLVEGARDFAIFLMNPEGIIESWNEGAKNLHGFFEEEILGKHFSILYPAEACEDEYPKFDLNRAKKKGSYTDEGDRVKKDGTTFYGQVVITALFDGDKKHIGFSNITSDLTTRKKAEDELRKSEEKYRLLIQGVTDYAIFMLDPDGLIESWNEGAKKLKGYKEQEIIGKHFSVFYPKEKIDEGFPEFELKQAIKVGRFEDEGIRVKKDGTTFYANVIITALFDKENNLVGFSKITRDLTERKQAEEQLRRSEEKYRLLVEGVRDYAIFMLDAKGYITSWNEGAKRLKRYEASEIIGQHFSKFYPSEALDTGYPEFELRQAAKIGRFEDEGIRIRKDGTRFYANVLITALFNKEKQLIGFSKITRDLTEKKAAEEELRKSEQRYRLLIEGVRDYAIYMIDVDGYIESWNDGAKRLKGYTEGEIIGKHFSIFYPPKVKESGYPAFELQEAKKVGRYEDEGLRIRKDGSSFYANVIITAIYNSDRQHIGYSKITRDLSEKKEAEIHLRRSEERYRSLVEAVKEYAIFMLDPKGLIVSWNEGAKRLKKYEEQEVIGKHFSIFYTEEKRNSNYPDFELEEAAKKGKFEDEGLRVRKDGSTFYANVLITPLYSGEELIGFSKITKDLTERKQAEENLKKLNADLEDRVQERTKELSKTVNELRRTNADLDNFIYTASHDLRAPVSNIEGLMYTLTKRLRAAGFTNKEIESLLEMINKSIQRFQRTVHDLTEINESQKVHAVEITNINVHELIEDVVASIDHLVKQSRATIDINLDRNISFTFSRVHFRSIIYNFVTNAIKYRSDHRDLRIEINCFQDDDKFTFEVVDNGLGIKQENKEKVFQMFKRLHTHVEGTGIGLYIVRKIVENAGGKIELESEFDKGTSFKVVLPLNANT